MSFGSVIFLICLLLLFLFGLSINVYGQVSKKVRASDPKSRAAFDAFESGVRNIESGVRFIAVDFIAWPLFVTLLLTLVFVILPFILTVLIVYVIGPAG